MFQSTGDLGKSFRRGITEVLHPEAEVFAAGGFLISTLPAFGEFGDGERYGVFDGDNVAVVCLADFACSGFGAEGEMEILLMQEISGADSDSANVEVREAAALVHHITLAAAGGGSVELWTH